MNGPDQRWVLLGLARVRSAWFGEVARWATTAVLPLEFLKCLSAEELRARLQSGRALSAALIDGDHPALDRDLIDELRTAGCAVLVVGGGRGDRDWTAVGASAVLAPELEPTALLDALVRHAPPIDRVDRPLVTDGHVLPPSLWRGHLVTVLGAGGSGTSTLAMALATGLAADPRHRGLVLLADLALDADQAVLHHTGDVVPGLPELIEAHRLGTPGPDEIRSVTVAAPRSGHRVLLGLRRHRDWTMLRARAVTAAVDSLRRTFAVTVVDTDADLEGERDTGSLDVEDRNVLARTAASGADLVLVTALPTVGGVHRLVRHVAAAIDLGIDPHRIVPVVNRAPRSPARRAELTSAVHRLASEADRLAPTLLVPDVAKVDLALRDASPLPRRLVEAITAPVQHLLDRAGQSLPSPASHEPERVAPGSLGAWYDEDVAG